MPFAVDLSRANEVWPNGPALESIEDLYSVTLDLDGSPRKVATHVFRDPINIIPYALPRRNDPDFPREALPRGVNELVRYFPPDDVGFAIKHRRTENRVLGKDSLSAPQADDPHDLPKEFKQHIKLQDIHIVGILGVAQRNSRGESDRSIVVVSNPAWYRKSVFYQPEYPMVFVRPRFPGWVAEHRQSFIHNLRTMLVCFNIVTRAPRDFDNTPLAAHSPEAVRELVQMMIRAMAGDADAMRFFRRPDNLVYCGELVHLAASAALLCPLNRATGETLVDERTWSKFEAAVAQHNRGAPDALANTRSNRIDLLKVQLKLAPPALKPMVEYAEERLRPALEGRLAFQPMTPFDVVEQFIRIHWPREHLGETLGQVQARIVAQLAPAFKAWARVSGPTLTEAQRSEADQLVTAVIATVEPAYQSYTDFDRSLKRVRARAEKYMADNHLQHPSTPPSMFHLIAKGDVDGGLLGLEYVGHGLHRSLVQRTGV